MSRYFVFLFLVLLCAGFIACEAESNDKDAGTTGDAGQETSDIVTVNDTGSDSIGDCSKELCISSCPAGYCNSCISNAQCTNDCSGGHCKMECKKNGDCNFSCSGGTCEIICSGDSNCEADCSGGKCKFSCLDNANCVFGCSGGGCTPTCNTTGTCENI